MSMTFEEYLEYADTGIQEKKDKKIKYATDTYWAADAAAGTARDNAITYAAGERERAEGAAATGLSDATKAAEERLRGSIAQADDTFERDKVTYGQAAERLAQAGLTGSGYSDNLTRDAFASRATLYADANRTNAAEKHAAEVTYRDAMAKAESDEAKAKYEAQATYDATVTEAAGIRDQAIYTAETDYDSDKLALEGEKVKCAEEQKETTAYLSSQELGEVKVADVLSADITSEQKTQVLEALNEKAYGQFVNVLNTGNAENIAGALEEIKALINEGYLQQSAMDKIKNALDSTPEGFAYKHKSGELSASQYIGKMCELGYWTSSSTNGGWYIQGLGTGRENDDVDITIGSNSRNKSEEFDLLCGKPVTDESVIKDLNNLATGSDDKTPPIATGDDNATNKKGKLVCYKGVLYLYTKKGWKPLVDDNRKGEAERAAAAFLMASTHDQKYDTTPLQTSTQAAATTIADPTPEIKTPTPAIPPKEK